MMAIEAWHESWVNDWKQTRLVSFMIYCSATDPDKRECKNEVEFLRLPGDPSEEEMKAMREQQKKEEFERIDSLYKSVIKQVDDKMPALNEKLREMKERKREKL